MLDGLGLQDEEAPEDEEVNEAAELADDPRLLEHVVQEAADALAQTVEVRARIGRAHRDEAKEPEDGPPCGGEANSEHESDDGGDREFHGEHGERDVAAGSRS